MRDRSRIRRPSVGLRRQGTSYAMALCQPAYLIPYGSTIPLKPTIQGILRIDSSKQYILNPTKIAQHLNPTGARISSELTYESDSDFFLKEREEHMAKVCNKRMKKLALRAYKVCTNQLIYLTKCKTNSLSKSTFS